MGPSDSTIERFGDYELVERIGSGGMAEVYRARSVGPSDLNRTVVVKKILPQYAQNRAFVQMLIAEARVNSVLQHPNIVQVYELGQHARQYYIAMEYVPGVDLLGVFRRCASEKIAFPLELALYIVAEVCSGLAHAHHACDSRGRPLRLIHRDVSPSNILLDALGLVKILDFGVAHADLLHSDQLRVKTQQRSDTVKGKLGYLSPEQVLGQPVDQRADIFALGVVLFESLTLERLFVGGSDIQTLMNIRECAIETRLGSHPNIPDPIKSILRRSLASDPARRFQSAQAFRTAIMDHMFDAGLQANARMLSGFLNDIELAIPSELPQQDLTDSPDKPRPQRAPQPSVVSRRVVAKLKMPLGISWPIRGRDAMTSHVLDGTLRLSDLVKLGDLPESTVGALPELEDHPAASDEGTLLHEVPINPLTLTRVMAQQSRSSQPRRIALSRQGIRASVVLEAGRLIQVNNPAKALRLGSLLLERQLMTPSDLADAMVAKARTGKKLGVLLVERGYLSQPKLHEVINEQLRTRFVDLTSWSSGWLQVWTHRSVSRARLQSEPQPLLPLLLEAIGVHFTASQLRGWLLPTRTHRVVLDATRCWPVLPQPHDRLHALLRDGARLSNVLEGAEDSTDERLLMALLFWAHQVELLSLVPDS